MTTTAVIVAADSSAEFDGSPYLVPIGGVPMLERIVRDARSWPVDDVVVVLGDRADEIVAGCSLDGATILIDPEWVEGGAAPLRAVLDLLSRDRDIRRIVLARGDQPFVGSEVVAALLEAAVDESSDVVLPKYRYATGWPIVISRGLWDLFLGLEGSIDIHDVLRSHVGAIDEVWFDRLSPAILRSPDDLPMRRR